jgi:hypothetical protein
MQRFKDFVKLDESPKSDKFENDIAANINRMPGMNASRPSVGIGYSDVLVSRDGGETSWLEVKMNHTDNLSNPRVFFDGKKWDTTYTTPAAKEAVKLLNKSSEAADFVKAIGKFAGIKNPKIPTTKSGLKDPNAVPLDVMKQYFEQPGITRYIMNVPDMNLGKVVTDHYTKGKDEPAFYMQAGDDFYMITKKNPLGVPKSVPTLSGKGNFRVRVATRSKFYEVQAEIKINEMPNSKYSVKMGTKKKNPFE